MSPQERRNNEVQNGLLELEYQGSYIYKPSKKSSGSTEPSSKRRKVKHPTENSSVHNDDISSFIPLLNGDEENSSVVLRHDLFHKFWSSQELKIQEVLREVDSGVLNDMLRFVKDASAETCNGRIPSGMITVGSNVSSTSGLLTRLQNELYNKDVAHFVALESTDAPNLKTLLKNIIKMAISSIEGNKEHPDTSVSRMGPKLLPYDLDLLFSCVQRNDVKKVVIALKDSEAFSRNIMTDLISLLWSWLDRIPVVLLFGVATSVAHFEERLPRSTVDLLQGQLFDLEDFGDSVDEIFLNLQTHDDGSLWLGHGVSQILMEKSGKNFQSPEKFGNCLKYAYMAHFFANPLAALLTKDQNNKKFQPELCEAIRNAPSFQRHIDYLLESKDTEQVRNMLLNDSFLTQETQRKLCESQHDMAVMLECVKWLVAIDRNVRSLKSPNISDFIFPALKGNLLNSKAVQDMLDAIKRLNSDDLKALFDNLPTTFHELDQLIDEFRLTLKNKKCSGPLISKYDAHRTTHSTTIVGQRLKLTKGKTKLSKEDSEYSNFIDRLHDLLWAYLSEKLVTPTNLFMHEAFVYDLKSPIKFAFNPRCRYTAERALSAPFDYLTSEQEEEDEVESLSESQPPISILYQLYLESGPLINAYDLWRAFYTMIGGEDGEHCDEAVAFALFYRSLAELKMMGIVRNTRRKTDHLAKSAWMGL